MQRCRKTADILRQLAPTAGVPDAQALVAQGYRRTSSLGLLEQRQRQCLGHGDSPSECYTATFAVSMPRFKLLFINELYAFCGNNHVLIWHSLLKACCPANTSLFAHNCLPGNSVSTLARFQRQSSPHKNQSLPYKSTS